MKHTLEPWEAAGDSIISSGPPDGPEVCICNIETDGGYEADGEAREANKARIITCVNACVGMADPAKEIARFNSHSDELDNILGVIPSDAPCLHAETGEMVADYILGLQKEVGRVHALYFNTSQQLEAMREAIGEVAKALRADLYKGHDAAERAKHALTTLKPFLPAK